MTPKKESAPRRPRGRPPAFDRAQALTQAMTLFWDRGYEGTSFDDLIAIMGISASSFYNSFTSKEALFVEAIEAYAEREGLWFTQALAHGSDTRAAFAALLLAAAEAFTRCDRPAGCMIAVAATQCSPAQARLKQMMTDQRQKAEVFMQGRLSQGIEAGDLPPDTDITALSAYFGAVINGMGVKARDGASRETLCAIAQLAVAPIDAFATRVPRKS